jgi:hypothetical protein
VRALTIPTLLVRGGMSNVVTQKIADEFALLSPGRLRDRGPRRRTHGGR